MAQDDYGQDLLTGVMATRTGTLPQAQPSPFMGFVRGYGSTFGVGTTDALTTGYTLNATLRTYVVWVYRNGTGGAGLGRIFDKRTVGAQVELLYYNTGVYKYDRTWSGATAAWSLTSATPGTGVWSLVGLVYDAGSTSNDVLMYIDGISKAVTRVTAPVGSPNTNTDPYVIGNRTNDSARNWDGMIGPFLAWDRLLSPSEMWALYNPATRWDLYWVPGQRVYFDVGAAGRTTKNTRAFPLGIEVGMNWRGAA